MRWAYHLFVFWGIHNQGLRNEISIYVACYIKMSKQFYFFKKVVQGELEDDILLTLWELLETWTSQNDWMAIFFIIFLVIIFEIVLIKICTSFQKKPALPEKDHSDAQEKEDSCLKSMKPDNWSMHSSSEEKADDFSERTITSSLASEENEGNFEGSVSPADETIRASTSESKYQVSHFSESHMPSSSGTSSFLSLFHSEEKEVFLRHRGCPKNEQETIQLSSKKLFSIMKNNKNENVMFSSDFNFSRTSRIIIESEDLDMVPCPSAHLLLSRDQVRLLEENVRNQIPLKSRATLDSKSTCVYPRSQEPLIQNQQSVRVDISAQTQDSFPGQKAVQDQGFFEAQFTSQARQFVNNQESVSSQPEIEAKYFALPQDLMRKPPSSSTQDSFQAQDTDRSQHLVKVPYPVETQDSIKGLESDKKPLDEAQYPIWFEDPNKNEYAIQGQNAIFKNARFLVLTLSPDSVAKGLTQLKRAKTKGQKQTASSKVNQCPAYGSVPLSPTTNRQKNRRKILHSKSKFSLKVPPQRSKKTPRSRVLQITVGHTPERCKLRHKHDTQKKEFHHRKGKAGTALHLIYVFKLVLPYIRKYSRKKLVKFMPGLTGCGHFLLKQNKSGYAEKVNNTGSLEKRETSSSPKNGQQHGRNNTGLKSISPKIPPQLEQSFRDDTYQQKASLIETNWRNKGSLKDPIIQAKEMDIAEFCVPGSEKTSDPNIAKHETPLEEAISEPLQKFVFAPKMELDRKTKTWEDLKSAENAQFPLSSEEKLPASTSEMQRSSPKGNAQRQKDFLEIVLESSDVNLLISLGTRKHKSSEQLAGAKIQKSIEDVTEKEKKPLILRVTEDGDLRESEDLKCTPGSNTKNMQDQRISDVFHNTTHTTISEPLPMEMQSRFKTKTDTSRMRLSPSVVKQDKLPDDKKLWNAKFIVVRRVFKKPQDHDREEEQQALQEAVPQLPEGFRFSLQLERKAKDVKFEAGQSSSESRTTQNKEREAQSQTLSPEMILGTSPCPTMDPLQAEKVKQSTDRPPGRETADPVCPLTASESSPAGEVLTETTECGVPFGGSPRKTPGHQMAEEKEDFRRVLSEVALASYNMHVLPSSYFKRQKIRKKLSGMKGALSPKRVIIQVKKPPIRHPRRPRGDFKIIIKQILQDKTVADKLLSAIYLHASILPHMRTYSRLNAENLSHTQLKQEKSEVEREETCSDTINKGKDSGNTKEDANLQDEVRRDKEVSPEAVLQDSWGLRLDAYPEKELKTKKEMHQPVTFAEIMMEPIYSTITDPFHAENVEKSLPTQTDLRYTADSETPPPASENSPTGDPLNQTGGSDVPDDGNDTRERGYFFAGTRSALPKDLPAVSPETFNCHMPALSHSKVKKNGVRFSHIECTVKPKSVRMKALKPSISKICSITSHRRKLESDFKAKFEKINQANGLVYEFLNTLYSPVRSGLQGETNSFCHAQVNFQELAHEGRPQYVDFFLKSHTFHDRGEKVEDGEEEEQKCLLITAPQHTQHLWIHAHQGKKTHLAEPDPALDCLTQKLPINEQDMQHQTCFTRTALQTDLQMSSRETKGPQKTNKPEDDITFPTGPAILPPETGKSSVDKPLNTTTECDLPSGGNPKRELDSYFVEKNSELPENLQVTFLQSSDSVEHFVSKSNRKNTLKLARKPKTVSRRYRTMREEKPSILHMLNSRQNKELQYSLKTKMKNPQQNKNIAGAFLDFIYFKVPILPNTKKSIRLNMETDMQRVTRLSHIQLTQEKSPNGREVCCPDSVDVSSLSNSVKDGKEEAGEHKDFPAPGNSQGFVFNIYQERDRDLVKSDEELKQPGSVSVQGPPQMRFAQTILSSTSGPTLGQFQFGKLGSSTRVSPPKSGEAKTDERMFSARECGVPSDANHQKEQAGGIEKKQTAALDFWVAAIPVSKSKRNFKQSSRVKTLVNPKCEIFKAKKPSISYMFNIKGRASPNHRKALGRNLTTKMKEVDQGKKTAGDMYSLMTIIPDVNRYRKREREKDMLGEKRLFSKQVKQETAPQEGTLTLDDTEETNFHDEEEEESEQEMFLKVLPQHSQHFVFCSGQRKELNLHKPENKGSGKILFVTEQDLAPQMPPTDPAQVEEPKRSHQTQSGALSTVDSNLPLLKSKEPLVGQVLTDTVKCGLPSDGSHGRDLRNQVKEEKAESHKALQAAVLESLDISTPIAPESKRQRKTFPRRALKSKMHPRCVTMKARKAPISQVFNIPRNGGLKILHPTTLKSQIIDLLIHIKYSGILENLTAEEKEGLAQELPATTLEFLDISTLVSAVSKRKQNNVKLTGKRNKMSPKCVTLKAKKAPISQTFNSSKGGAPSHRRQWECNFKTMTRQGQSVADVILNAISSSMPVSLDVEEHNRIKIETGRPWKRKFSHELQERGQSPGGEGAWGAHSREKRVWAAKVGEEVKDYGGEAAPRNSQHFTVHAHKKEEPHFVKSDLERKNSARKITPESLTIAQELQQHARFMQNVSHSVSCSVLNLLPFQKLPKRTKTQRGLKDTGSLKISSPVTEKSISESLIVIAQSGFPSGRGPRKELASSVPEGKMRLQTGSQVRSLQSFGCSRPASSKIKGWRNAAQIPESGTEKAQMAPVLKTINITRSGALSRGKEQVHTLDDVAKEIPQSMSNIFMNALFSLTPVSPAIKTHEKLKAEKGPFREKSTFLQLKQEEGKRLCKYSSNKRSTSSDTPESRWQQEKEKEGNEVLFEAGLRPLNRTGSRKDQIMLITEQDGQQKILASENILESLCSPLIIPFPTEKLTKTVPPQKDILHRLSEKTACRKSRRARFDGLFTGEAEYCSPSAGSPTKKPDVSSAVSLPCEGEEGDIKTQKGIKYTADQNIPPPKSGMSVLGDPCDKSAKRKAGGRVAKKHKELQRDSLIISMLSVLAESKRHKRALKYLERKDLLGPKCVTVKATKPLCSQVLNTTEHGNLYSRNEQECNLKSVINNMQQHQSTADAFSSPTPVSTYNKLDIEMDGTPKPEADQPRVQIHTRTPPEPEKSPCDREAWEANLTDTQNQSSNAVKMTVQRAKAEKDIPEVLADSVPHWSQHFHFTSYHLKNLGSCKSESKLNSSEGRSTWSSSCAVQNMRQEKHVRESILEPVSRNVMNFIQVQTLKKSLHAQERIKYMVGLKTPFPEARKSETGSIQCGLWNGNPRKKWDSPISQKKTWNQSDLVRTILKPLDFSSLYSPEPQSQSYALEFVEKKSTASPKHVTLEAKRLLVSQLLNTARCLTGNHRKKRHRFKHKTNERQWNRSVRQTLFHATEEANISPSKLVIDKLSFNTTVRDNLFNNRTPHRNLNGHITEEKAELEKKEMRFNIEKQKKRFQQGRAEAELVLNTLCDSGSIPSQMKEFMEVRREKGRPQKLIHIPPQLKLEKSPNRRQTQSLVKSATSRNIKTLKQYIREQGENYRAALLDLPPQRRYQLVISQQVKKEPDCVKFTVNLKRDVYRDLPSQKRELSRTASDISRIRPHTKHELLTERRVKEGDADVVRRSASAPQGREVSGKMDISLSPKGHVLFLTELAASPQKTHKEQERRERGSISVTHLEPVAYPTVETPHSENTGKVAEEDAYLDRRHASHLFGREGVKETAILQGSKRYKFLCTHGEVQQNMSAVQKGEMKPDCISASILDSVSCPSGEPLQVKEAANATGKEHVSIPVDLTVNPWRKEKSEGTDILLESNGQKINFSKTQKAEQQNSSKQSKENILESMSSCILHQLHTEKLKKEISAKGMSSTVLSPMVEKASNKTYFPVAPTPGSAGTDLHTGGRKEHRQESTCKALPPSASHSLVDRLQVKLPRVKKALKEAESAKYHASDTEGIGLLFSGKEEKQPEYIQHICPNLASPSLRDVFQSKMPCKKQASEEVASTMHGTPSAEGAGLLITGKGLQQQKRTNEALLKPASHSPAGRLHISTSVQRVKLDDTNMMHCEHSTPQAKGALKGMDVTVGYTQTSEKRQHLPSAEQTQQHLLVPSQNFLEHRSYPQNDPWFLPQLVPPAKEALSEAGNTSSRTKGSDLISKAHLNPGSEYGLEWAVPLIPPRQTKRQNTMLPSESFSENIKYQDVSFPKGKKASDGAQVIDSVSHGSSKRREKAQLCKAYQKKVQKEVCLPGLFLHSLSVHLPLLPESERQKSDIKQGLKKGVICPERTLMFKKSVSSDTFNTANYRTPGNRPELQWELKEKMVNMKHKKVRPDLVVTNTYEFIPFSPYLKLNKKIIDEIISNVVKGIKHHISQKKKDRIKRVNMKRIMDPNVILKAKKSSLSHTHEGEEWPVPLNTVKVESKVQTGKGKSGVKLTDVLISLPSLSHPNLNSRIKVGKGKSGIPRSCLPPLKFQASSNIRKTSFPESISRDSLNDIIESKQHLPQKKKEGGEDTVYMKDMVHRKCATFRRKKKLFKLTPRGQEPQWNNKEQEEMMQGDTSGLDVVLNKPHVSIPSSSRLEWGPGLKEEAHMRGVTGLCFPSLTLQELSDAMITCEEPMGDILSSIKRAKYLPQKTEDKVEMKEEIRLHKRIALKANQSPTAQELPLNIKEKEEKMQEDSGEQVGIQRRPRLSVSSPPYSEVDTGGKQEAVVLRKTRSPFPQPELQDSSDTGKIAYKESTCGDTEEEERVKMAKVVPLKKNKSPISQEIQLDIKEQKKNTQRIKGGPGVVLTCTSLPAPSTGDDVSDDVKTVQEYKPQRGEDGGEIANMKYKIYRKGSTPKAKILLPLPHFPSSPGGCGPQIRDMQTNIRGNLGHVQDRTSERDDVLAGPCLPQFKLNRVAEGKEGSQGVVRPCLPSSWPKESSDTKRLKYTMSPVNGISRDSKRTKYTAQREENEANIFERDLMHPKGLALKANKSPLFHVLRAKKLQVNIKEQVRRGQDGSKHTVVLLSKICPFVTSSAHLKFDTIKEEKGEPGIIRNYVSPLELQDSLSSVQTAPTKSADSQRKGGRLHPPPKEKAGVPAAALTTRPNGTDVKAGTASPPHVFGVAEPGARSRRKEPQSSTKKRVEQEQGRSGDPHVAPAKAPPSSPYPSHHRLDAGTKVDAGSAPSQLQLPESSGAGGVRYADPSQGISSCNVIIKANRHAPCKEAKDRVTTKGGRDRRSPQVTTLEAHSSALTHLLSGDRLPPDVKERGEEVVLRETRASLPSLSDLQRGPSTNQEEGAEGITQSCFPPLKIYDPFIPSQKADTRSLMLKEEDRLKTDTEDRVLPVSLSLDQKAEEPPLSHLLDTKKPWWKIKEQGRRVQRNDTELVTNLKNICTSLLTLPCLKSDAVEGEGYVIRITKLPLPQSQSKESAHTMKIEYAETTDGELAKDVREIREHMLQKEEEDRQESVHMNIIVDPNNTGLKAKESLVLLTCNPSELQWKTKEQEGEVQGAKREPGDLTLPETCISRPAHLHPHENTSIKEESVPILPRSSFPPVNFQKSPGSEEVVHVEPIASDTAVSPRKEEQHMSQNKGEDGAERGNLVFPKHQEKEMQETKAEPGMVPTTSSTWLPSLPALSLDKEVQVDDEMLALERSVLPRISNAGEIVRTQSISGDIAKDVQNEEQPMPEKEERVRERTVDTRGPTHTTEITLKSKRIPPSYVLHRTELHLNIRGIEPKKQEGQGNPPSMMLRKMYVSIPPTELKSDQGTQVDEEGPGMKRSSLQRKILVSRPRIKLKLDKGTQVDEGGLGIKRSSLLRKMYVSRPLIKLKLDKGTQVDEERLGIKRPSLLPLMLSALSDAEKRADSKGTGKQHTSEKEKKYDMKKVDMRIRMHHKEGRLSPISHVLGTKEFVLNVIKEPGRRVHKGKDEPGVVLTRTFLSIPSAPLYLDSGSKMDKDMPGITGSSYPQQNLQESSEILVSRPQIKLKLDKGTQVDEGGLGIKRSSLLRKMYVSRPLIKLKLDKGTQVDEERLGIKRPSLLPLMLSALSDAEKRADSKGTGKQHTSEKEKKYDMKKVDMRIRMHHKEGRLSPISHVLGTKEFVLNVIKEPGRRLHKGKDEPGVVLTRTFLSIPSAPLYLDSGSKMDKDMPGITGSSYPQQNLQESSDTQETAIRESVSGDSELVKNAEHSVPGEEAKRQWTSNFMISIQQRREPPRVKSEGDLSELNSQHEGLYFTGLGTIRGGKRLEYFFTGQEAQREKYRTAHFTTFLSFPAIDLTNIESLKNETEIMNSLSHRISPQDLVSLPRKISKEMCATRGTPVSSEGFSASEQDAHQQETLSKASPGSADSCKFDKPEEDGQNNEKISETSPPKVLAKESVEKMSITESNAPPNIEQEIVTEKQMVLRSGSGRQTRVDSSLSLKIPLQNGKQRTPLEIDVHKQTTVYPGAQVLPRMHMDITEFDALKGQKSQALFVPEQKERNPESLQKSLSSFWNFPPQFGDLEEKNETATSTTINLEQKKLDMKEGILKIDTNIAVHLEEDKIEMHKRTTVNLEEEKIKMDTSNTVNLSMASLKAEEPQIKAQVVTHMANHDPRKQKHKKEREVSCTKQSIQLQNMFQKHMLDSFYAYIPVSSNFGGQKGRLTIADVKRELSPKYSSMKIPKHPVLQILGNTGRGTPSNRKKLEYNFNRSKKISLWREEASGIFIRSLSISMMSPSQTRETVEPETNLERAKRTCLSKFPHKSPNASTAVKRDSSSTVKEGDQNSTSAVPQDSQPFVVDEQQMNKLPSAKSEANLSSEANQSLTPQTKERVVPGHDISSIVKEPDLLTIEQEKAPKSIQTPTDCPFMPEDPNENVETHMKSTLSTNIPPLGVEEPPCETQLFGTAEHAPPPGDGDQREPVQVTATQTLQQQKTPPGTEPEASQVKGNEIEIVADSPRAESLLPLYEAIKDVFEAQVKNMVQDKIYADILEKVEDDKPGSWEAPPSAGCADTTSTITHSKVQPKPIVESFTCEGKNKLTNHLESKAPEINLNLTPEMRKQSFQRLSCYPKPAISKHNSWRLSQRHRKTCFLSLRGIDTVKLTLKHRYQKDSPLVSCVKTLTVNVSSGSEEIITKLKRIHALESRTPSLISAGQMPLPCILQNYPVKEKDKLLIHFSRKTLEVQMKTFPRIVRESYTMASAQDRRKLLSTCIHSDVKVPKRENRILLLFEEKSLHQIDLDLRYKYTRFLLGLPVKSMFPKPNTLPKHILKLHTVAICKKVDSSGESGGLPIDTGQLEQHISFKKQSPRENSSLINTFLEPQQVCSSDPDQHSTVQEDTTALSNLKSHVPPGKDKQCHVWFQDTNTCESADSKTWENAHDLVDSHSIQNFEDSTDSHTNTESSETWGGCSALDAHDSEEYVFLEANSCLSQESQNILLELQKGMPLANLYRKKKIKTDLKPFYTEDTGSHHIRGRRKHSSVVTPPSCDSHKSRKYRSSSKMQSRDSCNSSLTTVDLSISSSIPFSDEKLSQTTKSRKNYSLVPLTESNIKLHLAKSQGKPRRHSESKERKKAKCDSFRKNNIPWECDYSYTQSKEKRTRKKKERDFESERSDYFPGEHKSASEPPPEDSDFLSEGKPSQPFFYACIPADSLETIPKTIRWTIPPKTLRKKDFRVPMVAKISSSYNLWSSSKKLLGSLLESFSLVRQK
ncbi:leucine-rich repeat transmembrane protein CCDC168 [Vicugna pacos]|uniref:Leucine-rich repeat transmembrane protein CCDC168 n=1 Tax=Vicugna pacos TaxID=30538 RepID=A0ABM5EHV4_VICPA